MPSVRDQGSPFKTYRQLAPHLREGVLVLPRPPTCGVCRTDCGFTKAGHYFRDFVFFSVVLTDVAVQRYDCKEKGGSFSALAAFQEPRAHYAVHVRGAVVDRVFAQGRSRGSTWRIFSRRRGTASISLSTVSEWCARFRRLAPKHAAVLRAHLAQFFPHHGISVPGDPAGFLAAARAAFGLYRARPRPTIWEWLEDLLRRAARRHLLAA